MFDERVMYVYECVMKVKECHGLWMICIGRSLFYTGVSKCLVRMSCIVAEYYRIG